MKLRYLLLFLVIVEIIYLVYTIIRLIFILLFDGVELYEKRELFRLNKRMKNIELFFKESEELYVNLRGLN